MTLFERLDRIARARCSATEPAHDYLHVARVTASARAIAESERADLEVVVPAALLHEVFNYPKGHPDSHLSGEVCAEHAAEILRDEGVDAKVAAAVCYAIRVHPFSRGVVPDTLEAKVLQDADRLDSLGAIGIARCFATCADMKRPFYEKDDPFCRARAPDDKQWGLDHFYKKLLRIPEVLHTTRAKELAKERVGFLEAYLAQLDRELR